jgi:hypothetical protein
VVLALLFCKVTLLYSGVILNTEESVPLMNLYRHHRRTMVSPGWRRLAVGLIVAVLMSVQGTAALAHDHSHDENYRPVQAEPGAQETPDAPVPGKATPLAQCQLCHSPFGTVSILPASTAGLSTALTITGIAGPVLDQVRPRAAPSGVWHVRGPPLSRHA